MAIKYKQYDDKSGFAVYVPFNLKDAFKIAFKSAKWQANSKFWRVGPRSEKRLIEWIALVSDLTNELENQEAVELAEQEIKEIKRELAILRDLIIRADNTKEKLSTVLALKAEKAEELAQMQSKFEVADQQAKSKLKEAEQIISKLIDLDAVKNAHNDMIRAAKGGHSTYNKDKYHAAQSIIDKADEQLKASGYRSEGLYELSYMNYNRRDRDKPEDIKLADIYNLEELA